MKLINIITTGVACFCIWAVHAYFKPPMGDTKPLSDEALLHIRRQEAKKGAEDHA